MLYFLLILNQRAGVAASPDVEIVLALSMQLHVEDILSLQDELNLHSTALEAAYLIAAKYKQDWLQVLLIQGDNLKNLHKNWARILNLLQHYIAN